MSVIIYLLNFNRFHIILIFHSECGPPGICSSSPKVDFWPVASLKCFVHVPPLRNTGLM